MAEAFVRILKCDYARVNLTPDARTVITQLPAWLTHYNEVPPQKALGYRSLRKFIMQIREVPPIQGATTARIELGLGDLASRWHTHIKIAVAIQRLDGDRKRCKRAQRQGNACVTAY